MLTTAATIPFRPAINKASELETWRVRLLSSAQHRQAPTINAAPVPPWFVPTAGPGQDNKSPPATISAIPHTTRRLAFSLKTNQASSAVNTPSRLSSRDAAAALVLARPSISKVGPTTPPQPMAANSHGHARRARPELCQPWSRRTRKASKPTPLPKYNKPASSKADMSPTNCLAKGVLAPNRAAAANAAITALDPLCVFTLMYLASVVSETTICYINNSCMCIFYGGYRPILYKL